MGNRLVDKTMAVTGSRADYCLCDSPSCSPRIKLFKEASLERWDESLPRDVALTLRLSPPDRDILPRYRCSHVLPTLLTLYLSSFIFFFLSLNLLPSLDFNFLLVASSLSSLFFL